MTETQNNEVPASLYVRLGGYDAIAGIVADLFERLKHVERFRRFGLGRTRLEGPRPAAHN